jgi:hypothetical protein
VPVALIHKIKKGLKGGRDVRSLTAEYWNPVHPWNFFEVFGPLMTVLTAVELPRYQYAIEKSYQETDLERAEDLLCACPPM